MSKIIRINKCEGFCKNRITREPDRCTTPYPNNRRSGLFCLASRWFLYKNVYGARLGTDWFKQSFIERCCFPTIREYKKKR